MEKSRKTNGTWYTKKNKKRGEQPARFKYFPAGNSKSENPRTRESYSRTKFAELSAAGILPYDENGYWTIVEYLRGKHVFTDFGGRYQYEDGDIYATIAREFTEEIYGSAELTRRQVKSLLKKPSTCPVLINGYHGKPVYLCLAVHISDLEELGVIFDPLKFAKRRDKILKQNQCNHNKYYPSLSLCYILKDCRREYCSGRLDQIIKEFRKITNSRPSKAITIPPIFSHNIIETEHVALSDTINLLDV
jgi:hypothetical protein